MTIGLDLGSHQFRSIRTGCDELIARSCPAEFVSLSDTPVHRRLLQQSNTQFAMCSGHLLIFGSAAEEWSSMLNVRLTPLLRGGRIPAADAVSRQVLTLVIDALIPPASRPDAVCCLTVPGGSFDQRTDNRDLEFFQQVVSLRGYRPHLMSATHALVLAELHGASFTGIGLSIGHATCEFGIIHCGREIVRCVVLSGLEDFHDFPRFQGTSISSDPTSVTAHEGSYKRFLTGIIAEACEQFERDGTLRSLPQPLPVICTGGITSTTGFLPLLQQIWNEANWPVSTLPIRLSSDPMLAVARGCLVQAELEQPTERQVA